jgi:hypothetical protein
MRLERDYLQHTAVYQCLSWIGRKVFDPAEIFKYFRENNSQLIKSLYFNQILKFLLSVSFIISVKKTNFQCIHCGQHGE